MPKNKTANKADAKTHEPATEKDVRVRVFEGHEDEVWRVAMPADGRFALTTSSDGTVRKWDLDSDSEQGTGVVLARSEDGTGFFGLAVTADGVLMAAGDRKGRMLLLNLQSEHAAASKRSGPDSDTAVSSDWSPLIATVQAHEATNDVGSLTFCGDSEDHASTHGPSRSLEVHSVGTDEVLRRWDIRQLLSQNTRFCPLIVG